MAKSKFNLSRGKLITLGVVVLLLVLAIFFVQDWHQLWTISSAPDNVPIVAMLFLVPFFTWLGIKQSKANDRLIEQLEQDPKLAKTHHRKVEPWRPGWAREIHVWPYLVRIEFLAALIVTIILYVWSITLNAPLEEPANPNLTMNPSKAPWYFLGLQEMLAYVDSNPLGNGYYTLKQRRFAVGMFAWGFLMWILLIVIGTFIRGPGWIWFWPGQTWDHNAVVFDKNVDLHDWIATSRIGKTLHLGFLSANPWKFIFGLIVVSGFYVVGALFFHWLMTVDFKKLSLRPLRLFPQDAFEQKLLARTSLLQYLTFQFFAVSVLLAMPVKLLLRLTLTIKYVWVTPWFNI